jgi:serine O-acetyltransferase
MHTIHKNISFVFNIFRCIPHLILLYFNKNRSVIQTDVKRTLTDIKENYSQPFDLIYLLAFSPNFRNLFYYRIGPLSFLLNIICPQRKDLSNQSKLEKA